MILQPLSLDEFVNTTGVYEGIWESIPSRIIEDIYFILYLGRIILILFIIYIGILILIKIFRLFFGTKESRILKDIDRKLEEILNVLTRKKSEKEEHGKKDKLKKS